MFETKTLPESLDVLAPDGSVVCILFRASGGSMAHFSLLPGMISRAVVHHTVEEIWYILSGEGEMWRRLRKQEQVVHLEAGTCLTIPVGTRFQFRSLGSEPLAAIAITMPPWPGEEEASLVEGLWESRLE
jgi:mannose-6-phosphate isomerase-like protein (cupin superfamily)